MDDYTVIVLHVLWSNAAGRSVKATVMHKSDLELGDNMFVIE